jgi:hypothetical protein
MGIIRYGQFAGQGLLELDSGHDSMKINNTITNLGFKQITNVLILYYVCLIQFNLIFPTTLKGIPQPPHVNHRHPTKIIGTFSKRELKDLVVSLPIDSNSDPHPGTRKIA